MSPESDIFGLVDSLRILGYFSYDPEENKSSTSDLNSKSVQQFEESKQMIPEPVDDELLDDKQMNNEPVDDEPVDVFSDQASRQRAQPAQTSMCTSICERWTQISRVLVALGFQLFTLNMQYFFVSGVIKENKNAMNQEPPSDVFEATVYDKRLFSFVKEVFIASNYWDDETQIGSLFEGNSFKQIVELKQLFAKYQVNYEAIILSMMIVMIAVLPELIKKTYYLRYLLVEFRKQLPSIASPCTQDLKVHELILLFWSIFGQQTQLFLSYLVMLSSYRHLSLTEGNTKLLLIELGALLTLNELDNWVGEFYIAYCVSSTKDGRKILNKLAEEENCQIPISDTTYSVTKRWIQIGLFLIVCTFSSEKNTTLADFWFALSPFTLALIEYAVRGSFFTEDDKSNDDTDPQKDQLEMLKAEVAELKKINKRIQKKNLEAEIEIKEAEIVRAEKSKVKYEAKINDLENQIKTLKSKSGNQDKVEESDDGMTTQREGGEDDKVETTSQKKGQMPGKKQSQVPHLPPILKSKMPKVNKIGVAPLKQVPDEMPDPDVMQSEANKSRLGTLAQESINAELIANQDQNQEYNQKQSSIDENKDQVDQLPEDGKKTAEINDMDISPCRRICLVYSIVIFLLVSIYSVFTLESPLQAGQVCTYHNKGCQYQMIYDSFDPVQLVCVPNLQSQEYRVTKSICIDEEQFESAQEQFNTGEGSSITFDDQNYTFTEDSFSLKQSRDDEVQENQMIEIDPQAQREKILKEIDCIPRDQEPSGFQFHINCLPLTLKQEYSDLALAIDEDSGGCNLNDCSNLLKTSNSSAMSISYDIQTGFILDTNTGFYLRSWSGDISLCSKYFSHELMINTWNMNIDGTISSRKDPSKVIAQNHEGDLVLAEGESQFSKPLKFQYLSRDFYEREFVTIDEWHDGSCPGEFWKEGGYQAKFVLNKLDYAEGTTENQLATDDPRMYEENCQKFCAEKYKVDELKGDFCCDHHESPETNEQLCWLTNAQGQEIDFDYQGGGRATKIGIQRFDENIT